jgi:hypothetical protein
MRKLKAALLAGAAASALVVTASPAQASTYLGIQTFEFDNSNHMCISDLAEGIGPAPCVQGDHQRWRVYAAPNVRAFKNVKTGRCMYADYKGVLQSVPCQGSDEQRFNVLHNGDGSIELRSVRSYGNCITYAPGNRQLLIRPCDSTNDWQSLR